MPRPHLRPRAALSTAATLSPATPTSHKLIKLIRAALLLACAASFVLGAGPRADAQSPPTGLVTAGLDGSGAGGLLNKRAVSADGRFVVFTADATNYVEGAGNRFGTSDVFVRDRQTGRAVLVSVNRQGTGGGSDASYGPVITPDGRHVAFISSAHDLVDIPAGTSLSQNVYVRDLQAGTTTLASRNFAGTGPGNSSSGGHVLTSSLSISDDGRYVAFESFSTNLVEGDTNAQRDVFVRDLVAGKTTLVSVNLAGTASGNYDSSYSTMTPDGRHVVFRSSSSDLVADDTNGPREDIFIRDLHTKTTRLVSANRQGTGSGNAAADDRNQYDIDVSADGRYVAFVSSANNLVDADSNGTSNSDTGQDVFRRDMQAGVTSLVSVNASGTGSAAGASGGIAMTPDGRFVAFLSDAANVAGIDTNSKQDVFLRDMQAGTTSLVSVDRDGNAAGVGAGAPTFLFLSFQRPSVSDDGRYVAFVSNSTNLVSAADNNSTNPNDGADVFVRDTQAGATRLVSLNRAGNAAASYTSASPEITGDGRFIVFASVAEDLVGPDKLGGNDVFIHVNLPQPREVRFHSAVTDAAEGAQKATVAVTMSSAADAPVTVNYATAGGTAGAGFDYAAAAGSLTFQPGETLKTFDVAITNDASDENEEKINVRLTDLAGPAAMGEPAVAAIFVADDDAAPSISVGDVSVGEGDSGFAGALFPVSLSAPSGKTVAVNVATQGGTALSVIDFGPIAGRLTFPPGTSTLNVRVVILPNTIKEENKTFQLLLSNPSNAVIADAQATGTIVDDDGDVFTKVRLSSDNFIVSETVGKVEIQVLRSGDVSASSSVFYFALNGSASDVSDYGATAGTLRFAPNETTKTVTVFITDDAFHEGLEVFSFVITGPEGCTLGAPSVAAVLITSNDAADGTSPVKWDANFNPNFFVRQHYIDFLNREPDAAGLNFWAGQITECETLPEAERQGCREVRRINVSAAFFLSIEFQETGYLVYRMYGAAFGTKRVSGVAPLTYRDFLPDTQEMQRGLVVGQLGWQERLEQNKRAFADAFVARPQFAVAYPQGWTAAQFVDALDRNAGGVLSPIERDALVGELASGAKTRAQVLRAVAEDADFHARELNRAFVLMQYFGYLRRDADPLGHDFWLKKLEDHGGNFVNAEMVKAFLLSGEYVNRFGR